MGPAARPGGLAAPGLAAPPMFVYTIYCEATTHSALLETGIREIKTGHRDVTFDQKTRFLNLSSIHARTAMLPKSLQDTTLSCHMCRWVAQGADRWSLGEQTRKLSKNQNLPKNKTIGRFLPNYALSMCCVETQIFENLGGRSVN